MTAIVCAGAASHKTNDWQAIDWRQVNRTVSRLQARIVKATQEGRWGKVRALQHLLTRSFSGKVTAVRRVTENKGKRTPGVDGVTWKTPNQKIAAISLLRKRGYRPAPLRRVYILKSDGKRRRPLSIPTMRDRAMQALYLLALDPIAETMADSNSYGFRLLRAPVDAIEQCFIALAKGMSPQWVLEGDIRTCFVEDHQLYPTKAGTPQGAICSPVMANMALDGLQTRLRTAFPRYVWNGRKSVCPKVNFIRFADDFVITGASKSLLENEVKPLVEAFLRERGLELSPEKTAITHIDDGFDFLGQNVRKYHGKLLIKPSGKSIKALLCKVRTTIRSNKSVAAGTLIAQLNPIIRGWAMYHRHAVSSVVFQSVDHAIFQALWRWAKRRHPHKGARWVKAKYFHSIGNRHWVFTGKVPVRQGQPMDVHLFAAHSLRITRHTKIDGQTNPYDPRWELYLEKRQARSMALSLRGRKTLLYLWRRQQGRCMRCGDAITPDTGWHVHRRVSRSQGGSDTADNRVLLHPVCHSELHYANDALG